MNEQAWWMMDEVVTNGFLGGTDKMTAWVALSSLSGLTSWTYRSALAPRHVSFLSHSRSLLHLLVCYEPHTQHARNTRVRKSLNFLVCA